MLSSADGGTGTLDTMQSLPDIIAGNHPGRQNDDEITLFISMGLAGTEVALAAEHLNEHSLAKL